MQETDTIKEEVSPVLVQEKNITVFSTQTYSAAAEFLKDIKAVQNKVTVFFGPMKSKAHAAWKAILAKEKELLNPLLNAESSVKSKMLTFDREAKRKAAEEQARLQAAADARAEKERERLLKEAAKLKTPELQEQRLQEAEEVEAPVIAVQSEAPKVEGISTRKIWKAEVTDKQAFLVAATTDQNLFGFITIDQTALNRVAQATKGALNYAGIRFYEQGSMAARSV